MSTAPSPTPLWAISGQRLALRKGEAAAWLGISDEAFDKYVRPNARVVRLGSIRLYPIADLLAFLDRQASAPLENS